jgi:hypothetical protein
MFDLLTVFEPRLGSMSVDAEVFRFYFLRVFLVPRASAELRIPEALEQPFRRDLNTDSERT